MPWVLADSIKHKRCSSCSSGVQPNMHILSWMAIMPGKQSVAWSIHIRKTPWDIFKLNGMHRNLYLPWCVLEVARYDEFSSRWMLQKPSFRSSLLKHVAPLKWWVISHYGLIKVLRVEAYMQGTIRLAGVSEQRHPGSRFDDRSNNSFQDHVILSLSVWSLYSIGTFCLACCTAGTEGSVLMV